MTRSLYFWTRTAKKKWGRKNREMFRTKKCTLCDTTAIFRPEIGRENLASARWWRYIYIYVSFMVIVFHFPGPLFQGLGFWHFLFLYFFILDGGVTLLGVMPAVAPLHFARTIDEKKATLVLQVLRELASSPAQRGNLRSGLSHHFFLALPPIAVPFDFVLQFGQRHWSVGGHTMAPCPFVLAWLVRPG